jgi:hypothetical protein
VLRKVTLFSAADVPVEFVNALSHEIRTGQHSPKELIVPPGSYGSSLCIVLSGQVVILNQMAAVAAEVAPAVKQRRRLVMSDEPEPIFGIEARRARTKPVCHTTAPPDCCARVAPAAQAALDEKAFAKGLQFFEDWAAEALTYCDVAQVSRSPSPSLSPSLSLALSLSRCLYHCPFL